MHCLLHQFSPHIDDYTLPKILCCTHPITFTVSLILVNVLYLCLLDLSAAVDTIQRITLLNRLHTSFVISGTACAWLQLYLNDRSQCVRASFITLHLLPHWCTTRLSFGTDSLFLLHITCHCLCVIIRCLYTTTRW